MGGNGEMFQKEPLGICRFQFAEISCLGVHSGRRRGGTWPLRLPQDANSTDSGRYRLIFGKQ
jgi:hypothetical protein